MLIGFGEHVTCAVHSTASAHGGLRATCEALIAAQEMCILADAASLCRNVGDSGLFFTRLCRINRRRAGKLSESLAEPVA